ncbi:hypothetical protein HPG69_010886 [Diceros bicornis minor]|uniref:Uncharacterized protein n=1 Tax=Diceros bicornis minor TaxID=77932 RepID=A0A7J7EG90_DICBM|nr:hypothetical protein HPG69_010886 [Diceros bicornis minor]
MTTGYFKDDGKGRRLILCRICEGIRSCEDYGILICLGVKNLPDTFRAITLSGKRLYHQLPPGKGYAGTPASCCLEEKGLLTRNREYEEKERKPLRLILFKAVIYGDILTAKGQIHVVMFQHGAGRSGLDLEHQALKGQAHFQCPNMVRLRRRQGALAFLPLMGRRQQRTFRSKHNVKESKWGFGFASGQVARVCRERVSFIRSLGVFGGGRERKALLGPRGRTASGSSPRPCGLGKA